MRRDLPVSGPSAHDLPEAPAGLSVDDLWISDLANDLECLSLTNEQDERPDARDAPSVLLGPRPGVRHCHPDCGI
jgi:hypothetical protein